MRKTATKKMSVSKRSHAYHETGASKNSQKYFWGIGDGYGDDLAALGNGHEFDVDLLDAIFDGVIAEV
jgi:hypothetical protein